MLLEKPLGMSYESIEDAFPTVDCGVRPFGSSIIVQIRRAKAQTKGGLYIPEEARKTESSNTQVARVVAIGPLAYKNRNTMQQWPEGAWCDVGKFVRVPKYGGDRWTVEMSDEEIEFVMFNDLDIRGEITGDPLTMRAFI
jgi:co-chaperonin GroES (HSP10)